MAATYDNRVVISHRQRRASSQWAKILELSD